MKNIIVIDNFYKEPLKVRDLALNRAEYLPQQKLNAEFPGTESKHSYYNLDIVQKIESALGQKIVVNPALFSFGVFSKTYKTDHSKKTIHVDGSEWTAVLYLSKPEDCQGGTHFYEDIKNGWHQVPTEKQALENGYASICDYKKNYLEKNNKNLNLWKNSVSIQMKFNRLLIFKSGELFHAADSYFGSTDANCRLLQLFFFNTELKKESIWKSL